MFIIGITGSIGSGKSTAARILADIANIPVVDADSIARELVEPGKEALVSIAETFGNEMLLNGALDRKRLGDLIFTDVVARRKLNNIMFPLIHKRAVEYFDTYTRAGNQYVIYDAPLLFESGADDFVDCIVLVYIPHGDQIKRICNRNNLIWEEATSRVNAQPSGDEFLGKEDYLIRNTGNFTLLNMMVDGLWKNIQEKKNALDHSK